MPFAGVIVVIAVAVALTGCGRVETRSSGPDSTGEVSAVPEVSVPSAKDNSLPAVQLSSLAFSMGQEIPSHHTCDGDDVSPALKWSGLPPAARSLAVIVDDPDASSGWVHWVIYGIDPSLNELTEAVPTTETLENGARQGMNDFQRIGYGGPCPPPGTRHHYDFKLYVLDQPVNLQPRATKDQLTGAMEGHVIASGTLSGVYSRP